MKKLIINDMSFKFSTQKNYFFHNVSISFESGTVYFIQGKNGVGKSTFFSILQGTTPHNAVLTGSIIFDGTQYNIQNNVLNAELKSQIKTMVQDINSMIVNSMTVKENLQLAQLPLHPRLMPMSHSVTSSDMMHELHIDQSMTMQRLSGGQKQIIAIMMALQKPTQILLLDEPTAALDEKNAHMVIQFLTTLAKKLELIVIIITHDKELTHTYAQHHTLLITQTDEGTRIITAPMS